MVGFAEHVAPRRWWLVSLLVSLLAALTPLAGSDPASSVEGSHLDGSFGTGGIAFIDGSLADESAAGVVLRPDGGAIVIGNTGEGPTNGYSRRPPRPTLIAHFDERGEIDPVRPTTVVDSAPGAADSPGMETQVVLSQPDGKLLLGGVEGHGPSVRRIDRDGRPDPSFGGGDGRTGIDRERVGAGVVLAMALQPDGAVVATGRTDRSGEQELWVARLTPNGEMDRSFGGSGSVTVDLFDTENFAVDDREESTIPFAVGVLPGGRIVVAGVTDSLYGAAQILLGFTPAGRVDRRFGDAGLQLGPLGEFVEIPAGLAVQGDGRFVVTGTRVDGGGADLFVRRHRPDGAVDAGFAGGGAVLSAADQLEIGLGLTLDPQGRVLVAGSSAGKADDAPADVLVARLSADGTVDTAFGGPHRSPAGFMTVDTGGRDQDEAVAVAVDGAGRVVLAVTTALDGRADLALVRLTPEGIPDPSLGGDGVVAADVYEGLDHWSALEVAADGAVVAAGQTVDRRPDDGWAAAILTRLGIDGRPDPAFGLSGRAGGDPGAFRWRDVTSAADGLIVAAGTQRAGGGSERGVVRRFRPDGSLDPTFGEGGTVAAAADRPGPYGPVPGSDGPVPLLRVDAVTVQPDQRIVVTGPTPSGEATVVGRLRPDGTTDTDFGGGTGFVLVKWGAPEAALATAPDGDILLLTVRHDLNRVVRLEPDGTPDPWFGENGEVRVDPASAVQLADMAVQPDGKVVAAGHRRNKDGTVHAVAVRLTATGLLDPTFGCNGTVAVDVGPATAGLIRGMAVDRHGRIVLGGTFGPPGTNPADTRADGALTLRLLPDGSLDPGFGEGGMVRTPLAGSQLEVAGIGVDGEGQPVVAGTMTRPGRGPDGFAIRYNAGADPSDQRDPRRLVDCALTQVSKVADTVVGTPRTSTAPRLDPAGPARTGKAPDALRPPSGSSTVRRQLFDALVRKGTAAGAAGRYPVPPLVSGHSPN